MKNTTRSTIGILLAAIILTCLPQASSAQMSFEGDFRLRWYSDHFDEALDNRGTENYMRYLGRVRARAQINPKANFYTELTTWTENNPTSPARNIAGTGRMKFGVSQIFAELMEPDFLVFDLIRMRIGRQQFPIGKGLSQGESYYFYDKFDGGRLDISYRTNTLSLFGAITGQNVSESGLYPDPGSDQIYIARLSRPVFGQNLMGYYIYNKLRGQFNDSYIFGWGVSGDYMRNRLLYAVEFAHQKFHTLDGLPQKAGLGYMGNIAYRTSFGPFRSVKIETRYAAYQGDDETTEKIEMFSPLYPSFFWGSRRGYVSGGIGGDYPYDGRNLSGTRLWFTRFYVIPTAIPKLRIQLQYLMSAEYTDNVDYNPIDTLTGLPMTDYNSMDDEFSIKFYYNLSKQTQMQIRFARNYPNGDDADVNRSSPPDYRDYSWSEDRVSQTRYMAELSVKF